MAAGGTMTVEAGPLGPKVSGSALEPFALVVFGASGDLSRRKLLPALFELHRKNFLPGRYIVIGAARSDLGDAGFRGLLQGDGSDLEEFRSRLRYLRLDYSDGGDYERLAATIRAEGIGDSLKVFHLAVPPALHGMITRLLAEVGLAGTSGSGARLVLEKPFGHDLQSARKLCGEISAHFSERQVFRIDHYLAKETVQNLLVFRFANSIFEPLWNRNHIRQVEIYATETEGVGTRAGYYDGVGVLRDMVQNHMLQLLALCALEPPAGLDTERVRDEKVKVLRQLRRFTGPAERHVVLGQYAAGKVGGKPVPGYLEEPGVAAGSTTPTFAALRVMVDNWRWRGVPFVLVTGKRLAEKRTEVHVHFRSPPLELFGRGSIANHFVFDIHPTETIELHFAAKRPGPGLDARRVTMKFDYSEGYPEATLGDYARVILDYLRGEQLLCWRQDGIELAWEFLEPLIAECDGCESLKPVSYPAGSNGPEVPFLKTGAPGGWE